MIMGVLKKTAKNMMLSFKKVLWSFGARFYQKTDHLMQKSSLFIKRTISVGKEHVWL